MTPDPSEPTSLVQYFHSLADDADPDPAEVSKRCSSPVASEYTPPEAILRITQGVLSAEDAFLQTVAKTVPPDEAGNCFTYSYVLGSLLSRELGIPLQTRSVLPDTFPKITLASVTLEEENLEHFVVLLQLGHDRSTWYVLDPTINKTKARFPDEKRILFLPYDRAVALLRLRVHGSGVVMTAEAVRRLESEKRCCECLDAIGALLSDRRR